MTPADRLRAMAEEEEKRAAELEAGLEDIKAAIANHRAGAAGMRKLADQIDSGEVGTNELLHKRERFGSVSDVTRKHHGLAIAKKAAGTDPFRLHITGKGFSQARVAKKAGCSDAALSRYRSGRPVPTTIANRIQALTDWPADAAHWPGGLV